MDTTNWAKLAGIMNCKTTTWEHFSKAEHLDHVYSFIHKRFINKNCHHSKNTELQQFYILDFCFCKKDVLSIRLQACVICLKVEQIFSTPQFTDNWKLQITGNMKKWQNGNFPNTMSLSNVKYCLCNYLTTINWYNIVS